MLYVVIPVFNRLEFTRSCLLALRKQTFQDFKVILVDDGSTDGTTAAVNAEFPEVETIREDGDLWWTASVNIGIARALEHGADVVMTLNNDTLPSPDFFEKMMQAHKSRPNAVIGALELDYKTNAPVYGGHLEKWGIDKSVFLLDFLDSKERKGLHKVVTLPGRGLLIPKAVFDKIGLFDEEKFPHYMADYDFVYNAGVGGFDRLCNYDAPLHTYPDESGEVILRKSKSLKKYKDHLFGIKGGGNLKNFTRYTLKNCPPVYIPSCLAFGYTRRLVGYWIK